MTATELDDLELLLERLLPDPTGFMDRVLQQLVDRVADTTPHGPTTIIPRFDIELHERLSDHNLILATALGACECWGVDRGCPHCGGDGVSGWTTPDRSLFAEYVTPAIIRIADGNQPPAPPPVDTTHSKEQAHEHHVDG